MHPRIRPQGYDIYPLVRGDLALGLSAGAARGDPSRYCATTATTIGTTTSAWRRTGTSTSPSSRIGSSSMTLRRSISIPVASSSAATMSAEVTDPKSLPPSPARAPTVSGAGGETTGELLGRGAIAHLARLAVATHRLGLRDARPSWPSSRGRAARGSSARSRRRRRRGRPCGRASRRLLGGRSSFVVLRIGRAVDVDLDDLDFAVARVAVVETECRATRRSRDRLPRRRTPRRRRREPCATSCPRATRRGRRRGRRGRADRHPCAG